MVSMCPSIGIFEVHTKGNSINSSYNLKHLEKTEVGPTLLEGWPFEVTIEMFIRTSPISST